MLTRITQILLFLHSTGSTFPYIYKADTQDDYNFAHILELSYCRGSYFMSLTKQRGVTKSLYADDTILLFGNKDLDNIKHTLETDLESAQHCVIG